MSINYHSFSISLSVLKAWCVCVCAARTSARVCVCARMHARVHALLLVNEYPCMQVTVDALELELQADMSCKM